MPYCSSMKLVALSRLRQNLASICTRQAAPQHRARLDCRRGGGGRATRDVAATWVCSVHVQVCAACGDGASHTYRIVCARLHAGHGRPPTIHRTSIHTNKIVRCEQRGKGGRGGGGGGRGRRQRGRPGHQSAPCREYPKGSSTKGPQELATLRAAGGGSPYGGVLIRKYKGVGDQGRAAWTMARAHECVWCVSIK
jgi:hypothetical protein